jgi:CubicO group peptidase (beta-lactamase class C family)
MRSGAHLKTLAALRSRRQALMGAAGLLVAARVHSGVTNLLGSYAHFPGSAGSTLARVTDTLQAGVASGYTPGCIAWIGHRDDGDAIVVGSRSHAHAVPLTRDCIFRISSMTKPVTAAAALMLVEEGKLRLQEPVERLLPELANRKVLRRPEGALDDTEPARRSVTVEDLLTLRLGWGLILAPPDATPLQRRIRELQLLGFGPPEPSSPLTPDEWLKRLGSLPLMAQPGERWLYNTGSYVLGALVARASGKALPVFMQERIFGPLGMKDTGFSVPAGKISRLVDACRRNSGKLEVYDPAATSRWSHTPAFPDGGAGLVSTIDDYAAFSRMLLQRGEHNGRRILSEASVAAMTSNQLTPGQSLQGAPILEAGRGWGYGVSVVGSESAQSLPAGAYGWNGGLGSSWLAAPRSGTTAILLTMTAFDSPETPPLHRQFWQNVFPSASSVARSRHRVID